MHGGEDVMTHPVPACQQRRPLARPLGGQCTLHILQSSKSTRMCPLLTEWSPPKLDFSAQASFHGGTLVMNAEASSHACLHAGGVVLVVLACEPMHAVSAQTQITMVRTRVLARLPWYVHVYYYGIAS